MQQRIEGHANGVLEGPPGTATSAAGVSERLLPPLRQQSRPLGACSRRGSVREPGSEYVRALPSLRAAPPLSLLPSLLPSFPLRDRPGQPRARASVPAGGAAAGAEVGAPRAGPGRGPGQQCGAPEWPWCRGAVGPCAAPQPWAAPGTCCGKCSARISRKKYWYDSPTLGSQTLYKPTKLDFLKKNDLTKTRKEDNVRCRVLNGLIHKAVLEMATTCEVSQEFYDLKLEICKVSLSSNFSACRVYWNPASTVEKDSYVESVLRKSAPRIRYLLKSQQIVGNVPPVVFIKDKEAAAVKEVEDLLAIADFGPPEEEASSQNDLSKLFPSTTQSSDSPMRPNLFGVDHELLNKQIMDYKKMKVSRHTQSFVWTEKQQQQLSKIQKKMKKKKARNPPDDDDVMPQKHLLDRYEADYWDDNSESASDYELQDELQEEVNELDEDDDKTLTQPTGKRK
nr:putative ribosome-binding factor A, mitochondrial isoform X1 [Zonotrichia albicollis]